MATNGTRTTATDHYTAVIDIQQVEVTTVSAYNAHHETTERSTKEVTKIVVRAKTLEGLKTKVAGHIQLIGDDL